jgi:predicted flap endonuclease-1-like 5' DNA nuclease
MSYPITEIAGIEPAVIAKLKAQRIRTTTRLLETASNPRGRQHLAEKLGVDECTILRWANMADRMRIKGVGEEYAGLLAAVGVDTVRELKYRNPKNLAKAMAEANAKRKMVRFLPSPKAVEKWIERAKTLPLKISY